MSKVKPAKSPATVAYNKKASHDYFIHERFEAGLVLQGWEVKSVRAGRVQLVDSYVVVKDAELWLIGTHLSSLKTTSTHVKADPVRTRKLLLHKKQINKLIGSAERKGYTLLPLSLYWKSNRLKVEICLASGKKQHDKRASEKDRDWQRDKARIVREVR